MNDCLGICVCNDSSRFMIIVIIRHKDFSFSLSVIPFSYERLSVRLLLIYPFLLLPHFHYKLDILLSVGEFIYFQPTRETKFYLLSLPNSSHPLTDLEIFLRFISEIVLFSFSLEELVEIHLKLL